MVNDLRDSGIAEVIYGHHETEVNNAIYQIETRPQSPPVFISEGHEKAYNVWSLARLRKRIRKGAVLVHFDAHSDAEKATYLGCPRSAREALALKG